MEFDRLKQLCDYYKPLQNIEELWVLIRRLNNLKPVTILEIGVYEGGTLKIWEQLVPQNKNSLVIGIEPKYKVKWDYDKSPVDVRIVDGVSDDFKVRSKVNLMLNGRKIDFLFIDSLHWNSAVEGDIIDYGGFVRDNGIIALHDTVFFHSYWDKLTWSKEEGDDSVPFHQLESDKAKVIFHKEEIKLYCGIGIIYKLPNQNVIKFRDI